MAAKDAAFDEKDRIEDAQKVSARTPSAPSAPSTPSTQITQRTSRYTSHYYCRRGVVQAGVHSPSIVSPWLFLSLLFSSSSFPLLFLGGPGGMVWYDEN